LEKIVAESTYGAKPGRRLGDLGVLYEMEQALAAQSIPATIIRAAYFMSNWGTSLQSAHKRGLIQTFYPEDFKLPMVAPLDIGELGARLMIEPIERTGIHFIEGSERYSPKDVAGTLAEIFGRTIDVESIQHDQWFVTRKSIGFSDKAIESFSNMTVATMEETFPDLDSVEQGRTSLHNYLSQLVRSLDFS
jgi:uncharacterized protein YbjT (DUF2867 family)